MAVLRATLGLAFDFGASTQNVWPPMVTQPDASGDICPSRSTGAGVGGVGGGAGVVVRVGVGIGVGGGVGACVGDAVRCTSTALYPCAASQPARPNASDSAAANAANHAPLRIPAAARAASEWLLKLTLKPTAEPPRLARPPSIAVGGAWNMTASSLEMADDAPSAAIAPRVATNIACFTALLTVRCPRRVTSRKPGMRAQRMPRSRRAAWTCMRGADGSGAPRDTRGSHGVGAGVGARVGRRVGWRGVGGGVGGVGVGAGVGP